MVLSVRTPRSQTLRFLAGQHVQLNLEGSAPIDLFVASCPCNGMVLEFHLYLSPQSPELTKRLFSHDMSGHPITVRGPFGQFALQPDTTRPLVLFAENGGFAPIKSLLEHSINLELSEPLLLVWYTHSHGSHYQENYCRAWADAFEHITYLALHSDRLKGLEQLSSQLHSELNKLEQPTVYVAGCSPLLQRLLPILRRGGISEQQIFTALCRGMSDVAESRYRVPSKG